MSSQLKSQFESQGYCIVKGLFSSTEVAELEREFDRIVGQLVTSTETINARWSGPEVEKLGATDTIVLHTHNVQHYSAAWMRALMHPKFLDAAEALLGPDVILHHSKLFQKPAENGAPFPMHQDWSYFPSEKDSMLAAVIHVSNATDEMGCIRVYPGSHKNGRMTGSNGRGLSRIFLEDYPIERSTIVEAEPGDVLFFHYFTIHGSMPNRSNATRKTVLVQLHAGDDAIEEGNSHPNEQLTLRGWNHRMTRGQANAS
jgi:ectoine hydroxylase-related dioxygenase (phytanoyl-CoA dioxygenase family)